MVKKCKYCGAALEQRTHGFCSDRCRINSFKSYQGIHNFILYSMNILEIGAIGYVCWILWTIRQLVVIKL